MHTESPQITRCWWKEAVVYQIYPRSFMDSNGDGIGDLPGITARLDYLRTLGVNVIWLSPHYDSPNADNGYDIRDYRKVMAEFGTMSDFNELIVAVKEHGMRLIIDLVVNHTSDEHAWFVESRKSKDSPYRDYYIWRPGKTNGDPPNDWKSFFSGSAWKRDPESGDYYLHLFADKQPDLNWDNQKVRAEVYDIMRFWLDKGVDGFRMDVIPFISKDPAFPDYPPELSDRPEFYHANGPHVHDYLQEMNREVLSKYDVMTVGEAFGVTPAQTPDFIDERRGELNMVLNFDAVRIGRIGWASRAWTLKELKAVYSRLDKTAGLHGWNTLFLSNHDNPRLVSTFGDDSNFWRAASAKALATMLMTLKGTPFIYQGDELGMTNAPLKTIDDYEDVEVRNAWKLLVETGKVSAEVFLGEMAKTSRDHARTPMQWTEKPHGGFTTAENPWFPVNPNYPAINAADAIADPTSVYHHYARLITLRKKLPELVYGEYVDLLPDHPRVFLYTRTLGDSQLIIAINFGREPAIVGVPAGIEVQDVIHGSLGPAPGRRRDIALSGWEGRIYRSRQVAKPA